MDWCLKYFMLILLLMAKTDFSYFSKMAKRGKKTIWRKKIVLFDFVPNNSFRRLELQIKVEKFSDLVISS
jgi:hypothetical protein